MTKPSDIAWEAIFEDSGASDHDFERNGPFSLSAKRIKEICQRFKRTNQKEPRVLCSQTTRESRPSIFVDNGLFLLPVRNAHYQIVKGQGYVDVPPIVGDVISYRSTLDFELESSQIGDSEMQHLDFAYASSLIRTFMDDDSLVLTIRGRKYTPKFSFYVGEQKIDVESVQTEVDAGYEGRDKLVLVEAKNSNTENQIIRQIFYPYKKWKQDTSKEVFTLFFEKRGEIFHIWMFGFYDENDYNSIYLAKSAKYRVIS
jgi:hypothetical protein